MNTSPSAYAFEKSPLSILIDECKSQIIAYKRNDNNGDSPSCAEIVRRAAHGDQEALAILLEISKPIIEQKCPHKLGEMIEDVVQEVNLRLIRKFQSRDNPYKPAKFAQFHTYLNLTISSVILNLFRKMRHEARFEQPYDEFITDNHVVSLTTEMERREFFQMLLHQLPDPLEAEAFRRRYALGETIEEIVEALKAITPDITKDRVRKLLEYALRRLRKNPHIQHMRKWSDS